ncbi:MAG: PEP-CTERM sorting domain-containing protein [Desulfobacterales bacterium]
MKKLIFVMLVLLLLVPATNSFSDSFYSAGIWAENRYYDDTKQSEYFMMGDAIVDTNAYNVFVNIPSWAGPSYPGGEYQKLNVTPWFGNFDFYKHFKTSDGYPSPGNAYANIYFNFFIDTKDNGVFDSSSDPYIKRNYPNDIYSQLSFVDDVKISRVGSDVIVSWNGIPLGSNPYDRYQLRIIDKATGLFLFDSGGIAIDPSNKYLYNLGNLSAYGENLYIAIEARQGVGDIGLANRSRYYASYSPVPEPATMLLFGAGLVGLAGFGRKRFKK